MEPIVNYRRSRRRHLFSVTYQQVRIADRVIYTTSTRDATPRWKAEIDDDRREISRNKKSARVINERRARASSRKDLITAAARGCRSLGTGFPLVLFATSLSRSPLSIAISPARELAADFAFLRDSNFLSPTCNATKTTVCIRAFRSISTSFPKRDSHAHGVA